MQSHDYLKFETFSFFQLSPPGGENSRKCESWIPLYPWEPFFWNSLLLGKCISFLECYFFLPHPINKWKYTSAPLHWSLYSPLARPIAVPLWLCLLQWFSSHSRKTFMCYCCDRLWSCSPIKSPLLQPFSCHLDYFWGARHLFTQLSNARDTYKV